MDLSLRRTFIPYGVVNDTGTSTAYLDYLSASYLPALDNMQIESYYRIEGQFAGHPELVSYKFYQTVAYWWVLCRINEIICPVGEFVEGKLLKIPSLASLEQALTKASTVDSIGTTVEV